ncbi:hypothetical protein AWC38_SpisGene17605 [Stylophora pistillata]|uniref:Uncharacterized protein n=1 Tax=Stylophora pistillata TaxID=50429 RepID=A0A2B4RNY6_STYPI|nr:hypothetical protein AWC38_SpisGene17605 [Stylophora pistillata]
MNKFIENECLPNFELKLKFLENWRKPHTLKSTRKRIAKNQNARDEGRKPNDSSRRGKPNKRYERKPKQIHDVAEFLGGDLKTKNQHILIVYKKIFKQMAASHAIAIPPSENNLAWRLALQSSSILSASPVLRVDSAPQVEGNLKSKTSMGRVESQPVTTQHVSVQENRLRLSASDPDLHHLRHERSSKLYSGRLCGCRSCVLTTACSGYSVLNFNSVDEKMKSTLHHGRRSSTPTSPTGSNKVDNSQLLHLFNQLKTEILQSHVTKKTFILIQELFTAAEKSFNLTKYFWKIDKLLREFLDNATSLLFELMCAVHQVRCCIVTGWLSTRPIDVSDFRLPPTWGAESTLKTGEVLRMEDDWRANFNADV